MVREMRERNKGMGSPYGYDKPKAVFSALSKRYCRAGETRPRRRRMSTDAMVSNLSILNTDDFFSPVAKKSVSVFLSTTLFARGFWVIEETNAMITSLCCSSAEMMTAGRTFVLERSVKGKGTRTMSPRLRVMVLDVIAIG